MAPTPDWRRRRITRRVALQAATGCLAVAAMPAEASRAATGSGRQSAARLALAIAQVPRRPVDPEHAARDLARNVDRLLEIAAEVQAGPIRQNWIAFPSGALNGWDSWDGRTAARIAIDPHGPEASRLVDAARSLRCTLSIGTLLRSPWRGGEPVEACGLFDPQSATARWAALAPDGTVTVAPPDPLATALVLQMAPGPRDPSGRRCVGAGSAEALAAAQRAHFIRVDCASTDAPPGAPRCALGGASCIVDTRGRRLATARGPAQQVVASTLA
jgi:hypothetical protein